MRIDLHTHSRVSDGTTAPSELVRDAAAAGLDIVALTDHDTTAGWSEAAQSARETGIGFVPGAEISTRHAGRGVHVLGYLFDPDYSPLVAELGRIVAGRTARLAAMLEGLEASGVTLTEAEVRLQAGPHGIIGRPHVADALIARGIVRDRPQAFDLLLRPGRAGFAVRYAPDTRDLIPLVAQAGGATVVAHPWGRGSRRVLDEAALAGLAEVGLTGIEVEHEDHSPEDRARLHAIAGDLGLVVTGASDYHGTGKSNHDLGCNLTAPEEFTRLLLAAKANAASGGGHVPTVVEPMPGRAARRTSA
jgi:hypothetical protein